jgi:PKD domain
MFPKSRFVHPKPVRILRGTYMQHSTQLPVFSLWLLLLATLSSCGGGSGGGSTTPATPTSPSVNRAPVVTGVSVSPSGMGIESATIFTFAAQGVNDPDGDPLTYSWSSSDNAAIPSTNQAASHVYDRSGTFDMRVTVTDPKGLSASAAVSVKIGSVTGTWDLTCQPKPGIPLSIGVIPTTYVATILQIGTKVQGTITAGGKSATFPAPATVADLVQDPRRIFFGFEGFYNPWLPRDGDFYFTMTVDEMLTTMTGSGQYCTSATGRKR